MSIESKNKATLNEMGHFTNGVISTACMLGVLQPVFTIKTYVMNGQGFPPVQALYRGLGLNLLGGALPQGVAFLTYDFTKRLWSPDKELTSWEKMLVGSIPGLAMAPLTTILERMMVIKQLQGGS